MPIGEKIKIADYVIDTSGTLDKIRDQVADIYRDLLIQEKSLGVSN
jgi:dephospho-CoA kinase